MKSKDDEVRRRFGWAEIDPATSVVAGTAGTWRITYHVGSQGVDDGGGLKISWRDVSDWQPPQFSDVAASNFATVTATGAASVRARYERMNFLRPWRSGVTVDIFDDSLSEGDTVTLTLGERSAGSPGSFAQTFCADSFEFRTAVDWCGTWVWTEVPSPKITIVSGDPHRLVVVGPSEIALEDDTWIAVKAEDVWGNPCTTYIGEVQIDPGSLTGMPSSYRFRPQDDGVARFTGLKASGPAVSRVKVADTQSGFEADGNPLRCLPWPVEHGRYWGDLHGQSGETVGTNTVESYFRFARTKAMVDFAGHQGNDFQITQEVWNEIRHQANSQNEEGAFVALVGYEWSGNTPSGGDRNVYYPADDGPLHRSSHELIDDTSDIETDCPHVRDLYQALQDQDALLIPHVGGRYANLDWHDPRLEPVIEVYSNWGEFEWFLKQALENEYRVGFVAGSDDHKGRPGAAHPGRGAFGVYGGLTCVLAKGLTRASLFEALRARRCYATTGQRIILDVRANGHLMGGEIATTEPPLLEVAVIGTAPVERVDLMRGTTEVYRFPESVDRDTSKIRVAWSGQRIRARNRRLVWDGSVALSVGRILAAEGYAFDSAAEGIREVGERTVSWESVTTGDEDGIILTVDAPDEAVLRFETPIINHEVTLAELRSGPVAARAAGIDVKVDFEFSPKGAGREVSFTYRESQLAEGVHAYWARVVQIDGAKAWSSPIYVSVGA
jgi:hypothetical protein